MKTFETLIIKSAWLSAILFGMAGIMLTYEVGSSLFIHCSYNLGGRIKPTFLNLWNFISYAMGAAT
jgi:hypothetical protein